MQKGASQKVDLKNPQEPSKLKSVALRQSSFKKQPTRKGSIHEIQDHQSSNFRRVKERPRSVKPNQVKALEPTENTEQNPNLSEEEVRQMLRQNLNHYPKMKEFLEDKRMSPQGCYDLLIRTEIFVPGLLRVLNQSGKPQQSSRIILKEVSARLQKIEEVHQKEKDYEQLKLRIEGLLSDKISNLQKMAKQYQH